MQIQKILEKAKGVPECQAIKDALVDFLNSKADLSRSYEVCIMLRVCLRETVYPSNHHGSPTCCGRT
jgi:hypothetical protein